jgi:ATP-binding cassette, subfamily B, multidrug efflux pump
MIKKFILEGFLKEKWKTYMLGITALVVTSLMQISIPKLLGYITDLIKDSPSQWERISWMTALLLGISIIVFFTKTLWRNFLIGSSRDLDCYLRGKLFAHLQSLPVKFYNDRKTGDLMAYVINDLNAIKRAFAFGLVVLIDGVIINLGSVAIMAKTINPLLTAATLIPVTAAVFVLVKMRKGMRKRFTHVQEAFADISDKVQENISGIRVIKSYVQEEPEIGKIKQASLNRLNVQMKYVKFSGLLMPLVQICFGISLTVTILYGSTLIQKGVISLGDFVAFNTYLTILHGPVMRIGKIVEVWQQALASIKRLDDIFKISTDIVDKADGTNEHDACIRKLKGGISIRNLSFTYPGSSSAELKNININLKPGHTLAITGPTGSGKSTLVNLLLRLYRVGRGQIFIGGTDICDIPLATLRENIGYVPQDNFLFSASIADNIRFFTDVFSEEDVEQASRLSDVYDNIIDFPHGFDTIVGERGVSLSGGQKQRISIARAIIKDPAILIFDDSLSAVDTKTEEKILMGIKEVLKGRTGIIIAHRLSSMRFADEIAFMQEGRIVESGTHNELMSIKGHYYSLYCSQNVSHKNRTDDIFEGRGGSI